MLIDLTAPSDLYVPILSTGSVQNTDANPSRDPTKNKSPSLLNLTTEIGRVWQLIMIGRIYNNHIYLFVFLLEFLLFFEFYNLNGRI